MRAEFTVTHEPGDFLALLCKALPPDNRACLARSPHFGPVPDWQQLVAYAAEGPRWRLVVVPDGPEQWQMVVEPVRGDFRTACESVWRAVWRSTQSLSPKLVALDVVDDELDQPIAKASVGLLQRGTRQQNLVPILVGAANIAAVVALGLDSAAIKGALPGFIAALFVLAMIVVDARKKTLVWHP